MDTSFTEIANNTWDIGPRYYFDLNGFLMEKNLKHLCEVFAELGRKDIIDALEKHWKAVERKEHLSSADKGAVRHST